jgi:4a-hydroxytetrahydrobiopterin dehydratase
MPPLTPDAVAVLKAELNPAWAVTGNTRLAREFTFSDFTDAMRFVNEVAGIAEAEGHHPDLYIFYNKVHVTLYTHAANGLTENDFIVAAKLDSLDKNE